MRVQLGLEHEKWRGRVFNMRYFIIKYRNIMLPVVPNCLVSIMNLYLCTLLKFLTILLYCVHVQNAKTESLHCKLEKK